MKSLNLEEYKELFESEGYFSEEDVENLKGLKTTNLKDMGITQRGEQDIHITIVAIYVAIFTMKLIARKYFKLGIIIFNIFRQL